MKKSELSKLEKASQMLKALAHPLRMAIVEVLVREKELNVTQLHEYLGIEQAVTSQHLAVLKKNAVVSVKKDGKNSVYFIRQPRLCKIVDLIKKCEEC